LTGKQRHVLCLHEDEQGALWMGTDGGLLRQRGGRIKAFTVADGLFDDRIYRILDDGAGRFWMSCNHGIFHVKKKAFDELEKGHIASLSSTSFGRRDGMVAQECNGGVQHAGWRASDGRLWFPTTKGVVVADPDAQEANRHAPPVTLEGFLTDDQAQDHHRYQVLQPGRQRFEFHYTAVEFLTPERVRYSYQLLGHDGDWIEARDQRAATYTNIDPGRYRFMVRASTDGVRWSDEPASLEFNLKPSFTQTMGFRALLALGIPTFVLVLIWLREIQMRRRQEKLAAIIDERTRELREAAAECRELSLRDGLTGLRNRRFFWETITPLVQDISQQRVKLASGALDVRYGHGIDRLSIVMVDLDRFKAVNDTHGHDAGDALLRSFAELLKDCARTADIVVRWGGEEFLVLLPGTGRKGTTAFCERLRARTERQDFELPDGTQKRITCSAGHVSFPFYEEPGFELTLEQLVSLADLALYHAKHNGRNRCTCALPGSRKPTSREEASKILASHEEAASGGWLRLVG